MAFLKWMLDVYDRIRKRSSVHEYWRVLCMLYRKSVGESVHANIIEEVNDVRAHRRLWKRTDKFAISKVIDTYNMQKCRI